MQLKIDVIQYASKSVQKETHWASLRPGTYPNSSRETGWGTKHRSTVPQYTLTLEPQPTPEGTGRNTGLQLGIVRITNTRHNYVI